MKLLTKELMDKLPKLYSQENVKDPMVIVKFFNPVGRGNWFAIEYNPEEKLFFGYASLFGDYNDELGYFGLEELEQVKLPLGIKIERDLYFEPTPLSEIKAKYTK